MLNYFNIYLNTHLEKTDRSQPENFSGDYLMSILKQLQDISRVIYDELWSARKIRNNKNSAELQRFLRAYN